MNGFETESPVILTPEAGTETSPLDETIQRLSLNQVCVGMAFFREESCRLPQEKRGDPEEDTITACRYCARRLINQAFIDEMTGIGNRYEIARHLEDMLDGDVPILLMFTDISNFGKVNKREGHKRGDELLIKTTEVLAGLVRDDDLVTIGRQGGDEIIILMRLVRRGNSPENNKTSEFSADEITQLELDVVERIITGYSQLKDVRDYNYKYGLRGSKRLGVRIGTTLIYPAEDKGKSIAELVDRADPKSHEFPWNNVQDS